MVYSHIRKILWGLLSLLISVPTSSLSPTLLSSFPGPVYVFMYSNFSQGQYCYLFDLLSVTQGSVSSYSCCLLPLTGITLLLQIRHQYQCWATCWIYYSNISTKSNDCINNKPILYVRQVGSSSVWFPLWCHIYSTKI